MTVRLLAHKCQRPGFLAIAHRTWPAGCWPVELWPCLLPPPGRIVSFNLGPIRPAKALESWDHARRYAGSVRLSSVRVGAIFFFFLFFKLKTMNKGRKKIKKIKNKNGWMMNELYNIRPNILNKRYPTTPSPVASRKSQVASRKHRSLIVFLPGRSPFSLLGTWAASNLPRGLFLLHFRFPFEVQILTYSIAIIFHLRSILLSIQFWINAPFFTYSPCRIR